MTTHWEHGYRTHGLWTDANERLGAVSLGPRFQWDGTYRYWIDAKPDEVYSAPTLQKAKRAVERLLSGAQPATMPPASPEAHDL
jgi:hypothetical protein